MPDLRPAYSKMRLQAAAVLDQAPGRSARRRAAHWALRPAPLLVPPTAPHALRLTALVLATHASTQVHHSTDMDVLARLCGHSPHQTAELLDRLTSNRALAAWHHNQDADQILWQLPHQPASNRPAAHPTRPHSMEQQGSG
ncbi:hypothetical protein [Streptomyces sp. NPDC003480]